MVIPTLSLRTWGLIAAGLIIAALLLIVHVRTGERNDAIKRAATTQAAFDQTVASYRHARDQARQADELNSLRVGKEQAAITQETIDAYQDRIAALRADFAERVRAAQAATNPGGGGSAAVPGVSLAPVRTDEAACKAQFPAQDALIASEQAEQLIALQAWARRQAAVDVNGPTPSTTGAPETR